MINKVRSFTDSTEFTNALKVTISAAVPVIILANMGQFHIGFTIALGAFLTYPSDIPSNLPHKIKGLIVAILIAAGSALLISLAALSPWVLYPTLAIMIFFISMISVYGQRASMISFSSLVSIALVFSNIYKGWELLMHGGLLVAGGLFYLLVSLIFYYIQPYRFAELKTAECIKLTSKYLKLRGDLWHPEANRTKITEKQLHLQVEINTIHETLREVLFRNRANSGTSNQNRKMMIVFSALVEVLELAMSTSFDHAKLNKKFYHHHHVLNTYQNLAYNLAATLKKLSKSVESRSKYVSNHNLYRDLEALKAAINHYKDEVGEPEATEGVLILTNMHNYAEKQIEKIRIIERAFTEAINPQDYKKDDKDLEKFLTPLYYPLSLLTQNLSFSSTIFRHSLRLTITMLIGFIIGKFLPFQNVYWILLTIVVIMRPGYGLTKKRSFERAFGTVLGGLIAFGIISFVHDNTILAIMVILSMLLGLSFTQINYKISATFVTIYVIFIYGMLTPNVQDVVQFRILDTLVGAGLAFFANYLLWPSWEFLSLPLYMEKSIEANRNYLNQISIFYNNKGEVTTAYKISRKNALIEIGNLMASFQRMVQEPKSKQKKMPQAYKFVVLNHTLLSSSASLGTFVQSYKTTKASEAFNVVVNAVIKNLDYAIGILKDEIPINQALDSTVQEDLALRFTELKALREKELKEGFEEIDREAFHQKMQEAQLVIEQLIWLTNISESIVKATKELKKN
ncbi:FUSC family protein [Flavobacterium sp. '19STA2R22 D10 B1']|uniref:FUSC family protein n=1 Tax=Flavobacterium aerium TaxID=3037261 RepID=UPI00278C222A|nr:FUSC family membrane protein [Flavobacterium sp. '19STA2R22 D10 B1']